VICSRPSGRTTSPFATCPIRGGAPSPRRALASAGRIRSRSVGPGSRGPADRCARSAARSRSALRSRIARGPPRSPPGARYSPRPNGAPTIASPTEASVQIRALVILCGELDPVAGGASSRDWVRSLRSHRGQAPRDVIALRSAEVRFESGSNVARHRASAKRVEGHGHRHLLDDGGEGERGCAFSPRASGWRWSSRGGCTPSRREGCPRSEGGPRKSASRCTIGRPIRRFG